MMCAFAPLLLTPLLFDSQPCYRRCRPVRCGGEPRGCFGPSSFFVLLAFMLTFPCLLRMAFSVIALGIFASTVAWAASCVGDFFGDCASWCADEPASKPSSCKPSNTPPSCKEGTTRSAPDHSSVSVNGDESSLTIVVSAPGVPTNNLEVKLQPGEPPVLTIKGESTIAGTCCGVNRTIMLPRDVDIDEASAVHADGVLTLMLPKKVTPAKQIKIEKAKPSARCSPSRKSALFAQIRDGVTLKATPGPLPSAARPVVANEPSEPMHAESDDEGGQWEVVKELADNIDAAILQELEDMGFNDRTLNASLLAKHDGSVKATVKELVARRRAAMKSDKEAATIEEAAG